MSETAAVAYETLNVTRDGHVAVVELDRPDSLNAFNIRLAEELLAALTDAAGDPSVGAVILTGAGRGFSSGFDLKATDGPTLPNGRPDTGRGLRETFNPIVLMLREMPQPVIAAVNGVAAGIGCSYALACDLVVAARSASFLLAFRNVGLVPDGGATVLVPARAGLGRALEMALLAEKVPAETAYAWGLANRLVEDAELMPTALELARRLAAGPPQAQADIKAVLNAPFLDALKAQLEVEATTQAVRSGSDEAAESILAFLQKRPAVYR
jgi:2-(1,2-epoxy-1,2-dihydrophenyl)acetyl-CoA isomerase